MVRQPSALRSLPWQQEQPHRQPSYASTSSVHIKSQESDLIPQQYYRPVIYQRLEMSFRLLSLTHFTISAHPKEKMEELLSTIKLIQGAEFDEKIRKWKFTNGSLNPIKKQNTN